MATLPFNPADLDREIQVRMDILAGRGGGTFKPGEEPKNPKTIAKIQSEINNLQQQQAQLQQRAIADKQGALADQLVPEILKSAREQGDVASRLGDVADLYYSERLNQGDALDRYLGDIEGTGYGSLSPAAAAMYQRDVANINQVYGRLTQHASRLLNLRNLYQPSAVASVRNTAIEARGRDETDAFRAAQQNDQNQRNVAAAIRLNREAISNPILPFTAQSNVLGDAQYGNYLATKPFESVSALYGNQAATGHALQQGIESQMRVSPQPRSAADILKLIGNGANLLSTSIGALKP